MPIFYSVVARGTIVLAEHSSKPGNVSSIAKKILETIPTATNVKKTYVLERYGSMGARKGDWKTDSRKGRLKVLKVNFPTAIGELSILTRLNVYLGHHSISPW